MNRKFRCAAWDGQQCKATKDLTACALAVTQGEILAVPDKVLVHLCPRHFVVKRDFDRLKRFLSKAGAK